MIYVDPTDTIEKLRIMKAKRILLQLPDGLKPRVFEYFNALSKEFNVIVSSEGFYGACDTGTMDVYGKVDCIVQLGHSRIPNIDYPIPVIFEEYLEDAQENFQNVDFSIISNSGYKKIGVLYSIQYKDTAENVKEHMRSIGFEVYTGKKDSRISYDGQVLGCNYSSLHSISSEVDCFLVISTGIFHSLGAQLSTDKEVFILDLNDRTLTSMMERTERIKRKRYLSIFSVKEAKKFAVVVDSKVGQYRIKVAERIMDVLKRNEKEVVLVYTNESNPTDFSNMRCDAVVFTGCPRVPIDDQERYEMPVLTVTEFFMVFNGNGNGRYVMDEIVGVDPVR